MFLFSVDLDLDLHLLPLVFTTTRGYGCTMVLGKGFCR
jgi:hypothetical protein